MPKIPLELQDKKWELRPQILLCGNIPLPMHGVAPREVLGSSWWNKTRQEAYARTDFHCESCGVHKTKAKARQWLEGHEVYQIDYVQGRMVYVETAPLCHFCHNFIHSGRLQFLLQQNMISQSKYTAILQHGHEVLSRSGIKKPPQYSGPFAPWNEWRLVVFGQEYHPKYSSQEEYEQANTNNNMSYR